VRRVGGEKYRQVDVRILTATNKDLQAEVSDGRFREDLLYRLQVLTVDLPPLRDRPEDIPLLIEHFLDRIASERGRRTPEIDITVAELLERYSWPGNVRELENVLQRLALHVGKGSVTMEAITADDSLRRSLLRNGMADRTTYSLASGEKAQIRRALEAAGGNRNRAATLLGVSRATLYRKLKTHQLN
jgi:DNA-binding NtrC family response regulator